MLKRALEQHAHRYYVLDDPTIGDGEYDALLDELRGIEREHPELLSADSPTQRVGGEPIGRLEKVEHLEPMLSLDNVRSEEELQSVGGAHAQSPGTRGDLRAVLSVRGRAEDRRPGDQPRLSRWHAGARSHARERRGGRGRDAQPAHDPLDPAEAVRRATARGGARRGLHVARGLHGAERAPGGSGRVDVHEPAQLGRRDDPSARPGGRRQAAAVVLGLPGRRHGEPRLRAPLRGVAVAARARFPGQPGHQAARQRGGRDRAVPAVAGAPRGAGFRDRRRGDQGRRSGAPAQVGVGWTRPALGGRVEVSADHRRDAPGEGHVECRQVRRPPSLCAARADGGGWRDDRQSDAAQRGGHRPQGHPRRART